MQQRLPKFVHDVWATRQVLYCRTKVVINSRTAPTAFTNGPVFIESQVDMLVGLIKNLQSEGIKSIKAQRSAQEQ
jgi:hypothetical protein